MAPSSQSRHEETGSRASITYTQEGDRHSPDLPDWQTSWPHLTADGKAAELTHPSAANHTRDYTGQRGWISAIGPKPSCGVSM